MRGATLLGFIAGIITYGVLSILFDQTLIWMIQHDWSLLMMTFLGPLLQPFAPVLVAGFITGKIAAPHGFKTGCGAVFVGAVIVTALNTLQAGWDNISQKDLMYATQLGYCLGAAMGGGLAGMAGAAFARKPTL